MAVYPPVFSLSVGVRVDRLGHRFGEPVGGLHVVTLSESQFARELRRSGFVARPEPVPVVALLSTEAGLRVVEAAPDWELMRMDCDR